jgi:serine/threonine protein kinase/tetratricopeptide (TPR) repeat protein
MSDRELLIDELFAEAVNLSPAEREKFLAEHGAQSQSVDDGVIDEVRALLTNYRQAESKEFLNQPLVADASLDDRSQTLQDGQQFEGYEIIQLIAEGGMGEVYLAEDRALNRKVAIKLVKGNVKTKEVLRRFRSEQQILANLQHANIARLFEAGATAEGLPFFVMEYVEGQPIDKFAGEHELSITDLLKLFRTVCSAVTYAHQNLIIHRDIKPGNILVTKDGEPKLLDFGIAKLLDESDSATAEATVTMLRAMTPEYASPEQVKGEPITTASDVYSLGVLLYELLTGQRPYKLKRRTTEEITKAICEQEPTKPSAARGSQELGVGSRGDGHRGSSPTVREGAVTAKSSTINPKLLRGDLDNIVLKALRKEPERRYASVEQFSEDIRRHLEGLPVSAHKGTFAYRATKFVKRNKIAVAATALIVLTLAGGIIATTVEARRANRRFNEARQLNHTILFDYHDQIAALPGSTKVRERLVKDALQYLDNLSKDAGNDVSLLRELAAAYLKVGDVQGRPYRSNLGDSAGALDSYRKALLILDQLVKLNPDDSESRLELSTAHENIGLIDARIGDWSSATENQRRALELREALAGAHPDDKRDQELLSDSYFNVADAMMFSASQFDPPRALENDRVALEDFRKSLAIRSALPDANSTPSLQREIAQTYQRIGIVMLAMFDSQGALEDKPDTRPEHWTAQVILTKSQARSVNTQAKDAAYLSEALENHEKSLAIRKQILAAEPDSAPARRDLADEYVMRGDLQIRLRDFKGAMQGYSEALGIFESLAAADPANAEARFDLALGYQGYSQALSASGDERNSLKNHHKAADLLELMLKEEPANNEILRYLILEYERQSELLQKHGEISEALAQVSKAVTLQSAQASDTGSRVHLMEMFETNGSLLLQSGNWTEASRKFHEILDVGDKLLASESTVDFIHRRLGWQCQGIGNLYAALAVRRNSSKSGLWREARDWYQRSLANWREVQAKGTLSGAEASKPDELTREIAKCDAALRK